MMYVSWCLYEQKVCVNIVEMSRHRNILECTEYIFRVGFVFGFFFFREGCLHISFYMCFNTAF